jgi:hypothetical protein
VLQVGSSSSQMAKLAMRWKYFPPSENNQGGV